MIIDKSIDFFNTSTFRFREKSLCNSFIESLGFRKLGQNSQILVCFELDIAQKKIDSWSSRDLSNISRGTPLISVGSISSHTRPVECIDGFSMSETSAVIYTADTMGVIKIWDLEKDHDTPPRWRSKLRAELNHHRTRINEMLYGNGQLWTGICIQTFDEAFA